MTAEPARVDVVAGQQPLPGMPPDGVLFHVEHGPDPKPLSYGRRLTLRQHADAARGVHPLTGGRTRPELGTCGSCSNRVNNHHGYPKCEIGPRTHSASTDCRAWWPACGLYRPKGQP